MASTRAVLFDLDGTLIDSAPDLAGAGNDMRLARGMAPLPYEHFRPMVGSGARGMVGIALQVGPLDAGFIELRDEFLARYEQRMTQLTKVFEAMSPVLAALQAQGLPWGIVTNKAQRFTNPLVRALGLHAQAAVVISGDTTPHAKPHPAPLLEAGRSRGGHGHGGGGLGLPRRWRAHCSLGRRPCDRNTGPALESAAHDLNYLLPGADLVSTQVRSWFRACRAPVSS